MRLGRIGFDQVQGYLDRGVKSLDAHPESVAVTNRITAKALAELLDGDDPPLVVDVRTRNEWRGGQIEGSKNLPLNQLEQRLGELPRNRTLAVHCQSGYRSSIATSLLEREGFADVFDLVGGMQAWQATQLPTVAGEATPA